MSDDIRQHVEAWYRDWAERFLKPDPVTYIRKQLVEATALAEIEELENGPAKSSPEAPALVPGGLEERFWEKARHMVAGPAFAGWLAELNLAEQPDVAAAVAALTEYEIRVELQRDLVRVGYPDGQQLGWRLFLHDENVMVESIGHGFTCRAIGSPHHPAERERVVYELLTFLAGAARDLQKHRRRA